MSKKFISDKEKTNDFSFFYKKKKALSDFKKGVMVIDKDNEKTQISPEDPKFLIFFQIIKFKRFLLFLFLACFLSFFIFSSVNTFFVLNYPNDVYKFSLNFFFNALIIYFFLWSLFNLINFHNLIATFNLLSWKKKEIVEEKSWFTDHILMIIPLFKKNINYFLLYILAFITSSLIYTFLLNHFNYISKEEFKGYFIFIISFGFSFAFIFCWLKFILFNYHDASKILFASLSDSSDNNNYGNYFSGSNYGIEKISSNKKIVPYKKKFSTRSQKNQLDDDFIDVSFVENEMDELSKVKKKLSEKKLKKKAKNKKALYWWFGVD
ncbi:hypothetical protein JTY60_02455 [symbiont of Argiope bruennichi]|uniref:hypothetical protein n=1 Tax=symbiont of Argiope bruennichi TaxID=2810479 RepID=UPI003DA2A1F0